MYMSTEKKKQCSYEIVKSDYGTGRKGGYCKEWDGGRGRQMEIYASIQDELICYFEMVASNVISGRSRGNVLASRSKVRRLKPGWGDRFFQDVKILSTSPPWGTLSRGSQVWDFRLVKEPQAWKIRPLNKI